MGTNAYGYAYDPIGNRLSASNNAEALSYAANALNQYTAIASSQSAPSIPLFDADGNLTNYNGWTFTWDAENRLKTAVNGSTVVSNQYDYMSRRVAKSVGGVTRTFLYDGWAMIQENTGTQTNSYVYGLDLSGSLQGAGTIGGILSASLNGTQAFYCYDANGNVSDLADASGNSLAHYEWDPYGNATVSTGSLAAVNPFRFSTKYTDDETGLLYYGYRYYAPGVGRWVSRDPIGEQGGVNIFVSFNNNPCVCYDKLGLYGNIDDGGGNSVPPVAISPPPSQSPMPPGLGEATVITLRTLAHWYQSMRSANTIGADKWFHCMGACQATRDSGNATVVDTILRLRELTDLVRNRFNFSANAISALEQAADSMSDMRANYTGINCPAGTTCECACSPYVVNGLNPRDWQ